MGNCDRCRIDITPLFTFTAWDNQDEQRYAYSQVLDEEQILQYFPGREVTLSYCRDCYCTTTGSPPAEEPHPIQSNLFVVRTLQSGIATQLARALFEECSYEVRHSGYEYTMPEWVAGLKAGHPNPAVLQVRAVPDLMVYTKNITTLYNVEVKTTSARGPIWWYPKYQLDKLRKYHLEAVLMVYVQPAYTFFVQRVRSIGWDELPTRMVGANTFYWINLEETFASPPDVFGLISPDSYTSFMTKARSVLEDFGSHTVTPGD